MPVFEHGSGQTAGPILFKLGIMFLRIKGRNPIDSGSGTDRLTPEGGHIKWAISFRYLGSFGILL